jgi:hypothetical protein
MLNVKVAIIKIIIGALPLFPKDKLLFVDFPSVSTTVAVSRRDAETLRIFGIGKLHSWQPYLHLFLWDKRRSLRLALGYKCGNVNTEPLQTYQFITCYNFKCDFIPLLDSEN